MRAEAVTARTAFRTEAAQGLRTGATRYIEPSSAPITVTKPEIALGLDRGLEKFASQRNAASYLDWESAGLISWGDKRFGEGFVEVAQKAGAILVDLTGLNLARAAREGGTGGAKAFSVGGNFTSAELMTIISDPKMLGKTTFYREGKPLSASDFLRMMEEAQ